MRDGGDRLPPLGTVLGVWAHPDDETYLSGGLMAGAVRRGERVACATATGGEKGAFHEERWPEAKIAEVRAGELARSLEILGVRDHAWLGFRDGTCASVDPPEGVAQVEALMRAVQPDSVLTFGPEGMTGHPDHKAVSTWVTGAFERAAKPGAKLYYATVTPEWADRYVAVLNRIMWFRPGTPPITASGDLAIDLVLPPDLLELKRRAIGAYVSQVEGVLHMFGEDLSFAANLLDAYGVEFFRLASMR